MDPQKKTLNPSNYDENRKTGFQLVMVMQKLVFIVSMVTLTNSVFSQSLTNTVHKTQAAAEKHNDMWCYNCHSMEDGDVCIDNITANYSHFMKKCKDDEFICMVKKFSYTTSTENGTSSPKMWSLERKCSSHCENGCIVIGERTKLYACTSCCSTSYCNSGKGKASKMIAKLLPYVSVFCVQFLMIILIL